MAVSEELRSDIGAGSLEVISRLAQLQRPPGSSGERAAAEILVSAFGRRGADAWIEKERVHGTYWDPIGLSSAAAATAGVLGGAVATAVGLLAAAATVDDLEVGRRPLRRVLSQRTAHNVLAEISPIDPDGRTLVIHAHHDAARTGLVFHPSLAKFAARRAGRLIERVGGTPAPMWGAVHGPALVAAGGLLGSQRLRFAGAALSAGFAAAMANIAMSPAVPGANDNLSGLCVLLELAERLARHPPKRLRVLLLSTGSEESFLEGMVRFRERHFGSLRRESTTFVCLESVGSPQLMLLAGEGLFRLLRYPRGPLDQLAGLAAEVGVKLREPFRYRLATDGQVPLRAGYETAVISSMDWYKTPSNYHWPSDRPEHLDRESVAGARRLVEALVRHRDRVRLA